MMETFLRLLEQADANLDEIAQEILRLQVAPVSANLDRLARARALLGEVSAALSPAEQNATLAREKAAEAPYMSDFQQLLAQAREHEDNGDMQQAAVCLREALALDPPALMREVANKALRRIEDKAANDED